MNQEDMTDNVGGAMAYALGWLSATYMLQSERRAVLWHALQSIVVFGGLTLSIIAADEIFPRHTGIHDDSMIALIIISTVLWVLLPVQTFRGKPFLVPVFAPLTKKLAGPPPWLDQPEAPPGSETPPSAAPPFCPKCGSAWTQGARSCANCGQDLVVAP